MTKYVLGLHGNLSGKPHKGIHDASYTLANLETKKIVCLSEIEKITGIKHDGEISMPVLEEDIHDMLGAGIEIASSHFTIFNQDSPPLDFPFFKDIEKLNFKNIAYCSKNNIPFLGKNISDYCYLHELAHVFTSFMYRQNDHEKFLGLVIEGCGSFAQSSLFLVDGFKVELLDYNLPLISGNFFQQWLPGLIFNAKRDNYSLRSATPGKAMAMAGYGDAEKYYGLLKNSFYKKVKPREYLNFNDNFCPDLENRQLSWKDNLDLCASGQKLFQDLIVGQAHEISEKYGKLPLYYSGGCALSIKVNSLLKEIFDEVVIPPDCSDIGQSLGLAALHAFLEHRVRLQPLDESSGLISKHLNETNLCGKLSDETIRKIAQLLKKGEIVAFAQGLPEIGPRALCRRSILASPEKYEMREIFNHIKQREYFRPVAPIVLDSYGDKLFENYHFSPFMLYDFVVRQDKRNLIPACVHVDQTARVQSIADDESDICKILKTFAEISGLPPLLLNTSLNSRGMPIASSKEQVLMEAKKLNIKYIVLGNQLIES